MPIDPTDHEDEYFKREEMERLRKAKLEAAGATAEAERTRLKELHWMRCPKCGMELAEIDFRGVNVDTCFSCGGMFFDKGEVEKLEDHPEKGLIGSMLTSFFGTDRR